MTTWIVTGANRGIGLELARQLYRRSVDVIATARNPDAASELKASPGVRVEQLDVADAGSVAAFRERLAGETVDVLINNAGKGGPRPALADLDFDMMLDSFLVNSIGPMRVTRAVLGPLRRGAGKLVVSMSSALGSIGNNDSGGAYGYRASKAALNMLNKSLALELGREGFRCVVMHPGWVQTDMGGPHAPVTVDDSVTRMLCVIDGLTQDDNGAFLSLHGKRIPW